MEVFTFRKKIKINLIMEVGTLTMNVNETAEEYIDQIPMWARKKNSLEDIRRFLYEMGEPDESMKIFHVAGTNGKGSVCAFLQSALINAGYRVGTFTSPHLIDIKERFCINGKMVPEDTFSQSCERVKKLSQRMMEKGFCHPSYFEFLFYMAMDMFCQAEVDYVILETGLGGRLDTTNVIRHPLVSIITSISLDHTEYLGDTIEKIAWEKAGIIKEGVPVVFDGNDISASAVIRSRAKELLVSFDQVDKQDYRIIDTNDKGFCVRFLDTNGKNHELMIPSHGEYQVMNALLSFRALEVAGLGAIKSIKEGFSNMQWPARMEEVMPGVFLDGAHNPAGIEAFLEAALKLCQTRQKKADIMFSAVSDKDYSQMIKKVANTLPLYHVAVAHIDSERGLKTEILLKEFQEVCGSQVKGFSSVEEALSFLLEERDEDRLIFCVGSLYLMGEIKTVLRRNKYDGF